MPRAPISNQKKLEIIKLWLIERLTYEKISERTGVSIGRISEVINEFKRTAKTLSLEEAVRIYGVKDEVELLLDLLGDLRRAGITVSEAKEGAQLLKKLQELGVKRDDLEGWIKLCQKISPSSYPINDFISASIELSKLENETGLSFRELLADYRNKIAERDKILKEIAELEEKRAKLEKDLDSLSKLFRARKEEVNRLSKAHEELKEKVELLKGEINTLSVSKRALNEEMDKMRAEASKAIQLLDRLQREIERLSEEGRRINEELAPKRKELAELMQRVSEAKSNYDELLKKYNELNSQVAALEKQRMEYVMDIADYEMKYREWASTLEKVVANVEGRNLTFKELHNIVVGTLREEAQEIANNLVAQWIMNGLIVFVKSFKINVPCPHCNRVFSLNVTQDFMMQLIRGYGFIRLLPQLGPLPPIDVPRLPFPGSTTIKCPFCNSPVEITYSYIVDELRKQAK